MARISALADKINLVRERIATACHKARRDPAEVTLVGVSKYAAPEVLREAVSLGLKDLGENRVQQLTQRSAVFTEGAQRAQRMGELSQAPGATAPKIQWHMIGPLQRNKVRLLLPHVAIIHSVDSLRLAEKIDEEAGSLNLRIPVLLEINASEEKQKHGVAVGAAIALAEEMHGMPNIALSGVMTMAAHDADEATARHTFSRAREIFEELKWHKLGGTHLKHLSMGMSGDFEHAIAEGATLVRVGSAIFGPPPADYQEQVEEA
jgi:PLP dependent protein